jgi:hypothetical protein
MRLVTGAAGNYPADTEVAGVLRPEVVWRIARESAILVLSGGKQVFYKERGTSQEPVHEHGVVTSTSGSSREA